MSSGRVALRPRLIASTKATAILVVVAVSLGTARVASAQKPRQRIVSTSGVPHGDIANYRRSPYGRQGMPIGMNDAWREFLKTKIADITSDADVVLHQGDQVDGRWGEDCDGRGVFGPLGTWDEKVRGVMLAGNIYSRP